MAKRVPAKETSSTYNNTEKFKNAISFSDQFNPSGNIHLRLVRIAIPSTSIIRKNPKKRKLFWMSFIIHLGLIKSDRVYVMVRLMTHGFYRQQFLLSGEPHVFKKSIFRTIPRISFASHHLLAFLSFLTSLLAFEHRYSLCYFSLDNVCFFLARHQSSLKSWSAQGLLSQDLAHCSDTVLW